MSTTKRKVGNGTDDASKKRKVQASQNSADVDMKTASSSVAHSVAA
jgi:hypothetical protein